jgi:SAM-dependent methyltransferase
MTSFRRRRAARALERQLQYQQRKAARVRGREAQIVTAMAQWSADVRARLDAARPIAPDARVLEVGSGAHGLIFRFDTSHRVGIDPLAHHYARLFPRWQGDATTLSARGEALPFADRSLDVVLCDNVVDHAEAPARIVAEIARVLSPSGILYFTVNVHHAVYSLASGVHGLWRWAGVPFEVGPFADHTVHLTTRGARALFVDQPLRIVHETTDLALARTRASRAARHAGDLLKRVFFKNALYEVIAVREG